MVWNFRGLRPRELTLTTAKDGYSAAISLSTLDGKAGLITVSLQLQAQVTLASRQSALSNALADQGV